MKTVNHDVKYLIGLSTGEAILPQRPSEQNTPEARAYRRRYSTNPFTRTDYGLDLKLTPKQVMIGAVLVLSGFIFTTAVIATAIATEGGAF